MKRSEVRTFIESAVNALTPAVEFGEGQINDFNSLRSHTYPSAWLVLEEVESNQGTSAPLDSWLIRILIAQKDALDSINYEDIVDQCDEIAQRLSYQLRNVISGYKLSTMTSIKRAKFIKKYADCITGVEMTFTLNAQDQTDVC